MLDKFIETLREEGIEVDEYEDGITVWGRIPKRILRDFLKKKG